MTKGAVMDQAKPMIDQKPLRFRVGSIAVDLWPEERAMLRDMVSLGTYPTAYTGTMQYLVGLGMVERLEECGPNGKATMTALGRELLKRIDRTAPAKSATLPQRRG